MKSLFPAALGRLGNLGTGRTAEKPSKLFFFFTVWCFFESHNLVHFTSTGLIALNESFLQAKKNYHVFLFFKMCHL